ncbi:arginine deiminase family protein [Sphingosinicella sp.]|uniref:arginine deiminase family protein n=1 Tax=Sphingosinicella sp. TaxID=1917971 RepID=UPI0040378D58
MSRVFDFSHAIARQPAASVVDGLRAGSGPSPAFYGVQAEHGAYVAALGEAGVVVDVLPPLEAFPDSIFVEDPAFVLAEGAILLRPGAPSRAGEAETLAPALAAHFGTVARLEAGNADGGDVLILPDEVLIGLSARTDRAGAEALARWLESLGRRARIVATPPGMLHFKTACALLDEETVIATPAVAEAGLFDGMDVLRTSEGEEAAANLLRVNDVLLVGESFPRTIERVVNRRHAVRPLAVEQIGRIDAGLSCMSLRW